MTAPLICYTQTIIQEFTFDRKQKSLVAGSNFAKRFKYQVLRALTIYKSVDTQPF